MHKITNVATIGGGTGHYHLLRGLARVPNLSIAAIVSVADNGGSSGVLRDELGVLPPGDILKVLLALTTLDPDFARDLLLDRFEGNRFKGHTIGNLLLANIAESKGMLYAIEAMRMALGVEHTVLPATTTSLHLHATLGNGHALNGEREIDGYRGDEPIADLSLSHAHAGVYPPVVSIIRRCDCVIVAPGSLNTSLRPVLLLHSIAAALQETRGRKMFVCNTMTTRGDTHAMCPHEMTAVLEDTMGCKFDTVLVNSSQFDSGVLESYAKEGKFPLRCHGHCHPDERFIERPLVVGHVLLRHEYALLASALTEILGTL